MEVFFALIVFVGVLFFAVTRLNNADIDVDPSNNKSDPARSHLQPLPPSKPQRTSVNAPSHWASVSVPSQEGVNRQLSGKAYVTDGDGLRIRREEIRLFGVDAPEFGHPHGKQAKWALFELTKGQIVRAEVIGQDDHGRTVARCFLADGRDLSAEMVKQGLALDWPKFSGGIYKRFEPMGVRRKLWLADARQNGRMHVWDAYQRRSQ